MRRIALIVGLLAVLGAGVATSAGADDSHTYELEMYNAFGLVEGSDVRVAGVNAGSVTDLSINADKRAVVTVELSGELGRLGEDTKCSSEPQSLIAEYFISCDPAGPVLEEDDDAEEPDADIPASRVEQTVQPDLVFNTMREPFRRRLQLLINEFGTALAGNPEDLNEAIRLGAPALTELRKVTQILASQNTIIRDLNADSDEVIGQLASRREDVVRFIREARDTAAISVERRAELSRDFEVLDDFLAELDPTLADLEELANEQTPLLTDLRGAAPQLNRLATNLPGFNSATETSLETLGDASLVGTRALRRGRDEIRLLAESGQSAPLTGEILADFLRDLDDPRRAVEIDDRAVADTGRTSPRPGTNNTKGYTGLEGLLNYVYYQTGALNQYDQVGHLLHFNLYNIFTGPCGHFSSGRDPVTGEPGLPAEGGGTTTNVLEMDNCIAALGPNQPGINEDLNLPKYDPSVCPNGTQPVAAERELCDPNEPVSAEGDVGGPGTARAAGGGADDGGGGPPSTTPSVPDDGAGSDGGGAPNLPDLPDGPISDEELDDLLDLPPSALEDLRDELGNGVRGLGNGSRNNNANGGGAAGGGGATGGGQLPAQDLLDFLFSG